MLQIAAHKFADVHKKKFTDHYLLSVNQKSPNKKNILRKGPFRIIQNLSNMNYIMN